MAAIERQTEPTAMEKSHSHFTTTINPLALLLIRHEQKRKRWNQQLEARSSPFEPFVRQRSRVDLSFHWMPGTGEEGHPKKTPPLFALPGTPIPTSSQASRSSSFTVSSSPPSAPLSLASSPDSKTMPKSAPGSLIETSSSSSSSSSSSPSRHGKESAAASFDPPAARSRATTISALPTQQLRILRKQRDKEKEQEREREREREQQQRRSQLAALQTPTILQRFTFEGFTEFVYKSFPLESSWTVTEIRKYISQVTGIPAAHFDILTVVGTHTRILAETETPLTVIESPRVAKQEEQRAVSPVKARSKKRLPSLRRKADSQHGGNADGGGIEPAPSSLVLSHRQYICRRREEPQQDVAVNHSDKHAPVSTAVPPLHPSIVRTLGEFLVNNGVTEVLGIFRLKGEPRRQKPLLQGIASVYEELSGTQQQQEEEQHNSSPQQQQQLLLLQPPTKEKEVLTLEFQGCSCHDVANILKKYLREQPESVIPSCDYDTWMHRFLLPDLAATRPDSFWDVVSRMHIPSEIPADVASQSVLPSSTVELLISSLFRELVAAEVLAATSTGTDQKIRGSTYLGQALTRLIINRLRCRLKASPAHHYLQTSPSQSSSSSSSSSSSPSSSSSSSSTSTTTPTSDSTADQILDESSLPRPQPTESERRSISFSCCSELAFFLELCADPGSFSLTISSFTDAFKALSESYPILPLDATILQHILQEHTDVLAKSSQIGALTFFPLSDLKRLLAVVLDDPQVASDALGALKATQLERAKAGVVRQAKLPGQLEGSALNPRLLAALAKPLVDLLTPSLQEVLEIVLLLCSQITANESVNKMSAANLASMFAPSLIRQSRGSGNMILDLESIKRECRVVELLVVAAPELFGRSSPLETPRTSVSIEPQTTAGSSLDDLDSETGSPRVTFGGLSPDRSTDVHTAKLLQIDEKIRLNQEGMATAQNDLLTIECELAEVEKLLRKYQSECRKYPDDPNALFLRSPVSPVIKAVELPS